MSARPESEKVVINGQELPEELYPAFRRLELALADCMVSAAQRKAAEEAAARKAEQPTEVPA